MMDLKDYKPGLVKSRDVCRLLAICPRTLKEYIDDGRITPFKLPGGHFRYRFVDVLGLLQFSDGDPGPFDDTWSPDGQRVAPGTQMPQGNAQALALGGQS